MDFSSVRRALESLSRRHPPLSESTLGIGLNLLSICNSSDKDDAAESFLSGVVSLITATDPCYRSKSSESSFPDEKCADEDKESESAFVVNKESEGVWTTSSGIKIQTGVRWEPLAVGLYVATELLTQQKDHSQDGTTDSTEEGVVYVDGPRVPSMVPSEAIAPSKLPKLSIKQIESLRQELHKTAMGNLEHREPRVRTLVAKAIGSYAKLSHLLAPEENANKERINEMHHRLVQSIHEHILSGRDRDVNKYSRSSDGALDDTTGWRSLETNWLALASMISSLSSPYLSEFYSSMEVLLQDCEYSSVTHVNRHVRAASMACLEQIVRVCAVAAKESQDRDANLFLRVQQILTDPSSSSTTSVRKTVVAVCRAGLADNWSQVRMAASVLCRVFLVTLNELHSPVDDIYPVLLPRMCLNRFYLAQGVKLYSHETWKIVFPTSALPMIVDNLPAVCRYYVKMCDADNHAVREAACQSIAEIAVRLGGHEQYREVLKDSVSMLLQALLMCFHDESWPVRDEACLACGIICKSFPEECRPELKLLWDRWSEQLTDQIWSVREDAAVALGDALEAYGPEFMDKIRDLIKRILPAARDQAPMTREQFKAHSNDIEAHSNSQLYSCGSLAPKLRKGGAGRIGCSSCGIDRPKAPWEATDGCIYLIRELCRKCCRPSTQPIDDITNPSYTPPPREDILLSDDELKPLMKELADVCRVQHFPQADDLRTTLFRNLPVMAYAMGKDRFKKHYLDIFMDLLFASLESRSTSQLCHHAAGQCAEELASLVGMAIFRARLEDYQRSLFDQVLRERREMPKGPSEDSVFSPFGPTGLLDPVMMSRPKV